MKKKRVTKINARRIQDSDIAIGERIRARRNQIDMSQERLGGAVQRDGSDRRWREGSARKHAVLSLCIFQGRCRYY